MLLSHEDESERTRARSADACRRGLPILRAGGVRPRASPTWIEGSVDPEVAERANQFDRCQPWRADRSRRPIVERLHLRSAILSRFTSSRVSRGRLNGVLQVRGGLAGSQMRRGGARRGDSTTRQTSTTWPQVHVTIERERVPGLDVDDVPGDLKV